MVPAGNTLGVLRARVKITSHFKHRCIPPGCVAKARNMPDIPALSRLARQAPQHLKLGTYFYDAINIYPPPTGGKIPIRSFSFKTVSGGHLQPLMKISLT